MSSSIWTISLWDLKLKWWGVSCVFDEGIWTISLWDLKLCFLVFNYYNLTIFELFPYGIWNYRYKCKYWNKIHLNYFPMGFETASWFIGLRLPTKFELFPYGIWNLTASANVAEFINIWTISLWDLKLEAWPQSTIIQKFELFPYGIWNLKHDPRVQLSKNLNYFPMGFET